MSTFKKCVPIKNSAPQNPQNFIHLVEAKKISDFSGKIVQNWFKIGTFSVRKFVKIQILLQRIKQQAGSENLARVPNR